MLCELGMIMIASGGGRGDHDLSVLYSSLLFPVLFDLCTGCSFVLGVVCLFCLGPCHVTGISSRCVLVVVGCFFYDPITFVLTSLY